MLALVQNNKRELSVYKWISQLHQASASTWVGVGRGGGGIHASLRYICVPVCSHRVYEDLNVQEISERRVREYQDPLHDDDSFALGPTYMT